MMTSGGRDSRDALFLCVGDASRVDVNVDVVGVDVGMLRFAIFFLIFFRVPLCYVPISLSLSLSSSRVLTRP